MSLKAVFIPFEENLIEELSNRLIEGMRDRDLSRIAVVFPGKRPYYYLISSLSKKCGGSIIPPLITSMDEFISKFLSWYGFEFSPLNDLDAVYILYEIFKKENKDYQLPPLYVESFKKFENFLHWGFEILRVIEEMDEVLVDERKIEELKKYLRIGGELSPQESMMLCISDLIFKFHEEMERMRLWTRGYRYRKVSALPVGEILKEKNIEKIFFVGFFLFTVSERELIEKAGDSLDVNLFFHLSHPEDLEEFKEMLKNLKIKEVERIPSTKNFPIEHKFSFHPASSLHFELFYLSNLLKEEKEWNALAIVLPRSETLIPLLSDVMSRFDVEFNVSMGYPLERSSLFLLFESILKLQETKHGGLYYLNSYLSLIKHPYVKNIRINNNTGAFIFRKLEEKLTRDRLIFFSLDEVEKIVHEIARGRDRETAVEVMRIFHKVFIRDFEGVKSLKGLSSLFEEVIKFLLKNSDFGHHPLSSETLEGFLKFLRDMRNSLLKDEEFDIEALKRIFKGLAGTYRIPLPGVPLKGTQIIGMLETRCLNFKKVVILDVNEGILPGVRKYDPILSPLIRRNLGIPVYRDNELIYRYHFMRLVGSAERVMIFYIKNPDMPRSRFVEELIWEIEKKTKRLFSEEEIKVPVQIFLSENAGGIKKDVSTLKILENMEFTPTDIDLYLECPFKFYIKKILKLSPPEIMEEEIEALDVGNVIHSALYKIFQPYLKKKLSQSDFDEMKESVEKNVEDAMRETLKVITPEREILKKIVIKTIETYLEKEKALSSSIEVLELESPGEMKLKINGKEVKIKGRGDRVDMRDGKILVIDYKTGSIDKYNYRKGIKACFHDMPSRQEIKGIGIESFQLPSYVLIYKDKYSPLCSVDACVISLRDIKKKEWRVKLGEYSEKFSEEIFRKMISGIIGEILNPEIPFYTDEGEKCSKCFCLTPCLSLRTR